MKVGILGGGQLAQMLVEASIPLGIDVSVLADAPLSPASYVTKQLTVGVFDVPTLRSFMSDKTHILFESEFVDTKLLQEASRGIGVDFIPSLAVMSRFQDKLSQKEFCVENGLPTSPYDVYESGDIGSWCQRVVAEFGGCVFKWATLGYDGKGNFFAKGDHDKKSLVEFVESALRRGSRVYAEKLISFSDEAAIVGVRSSQGEWNNYPVVYSKQTRGICLSVTGPAISLGLDPKIADQIVSIARAVGDKGGIVGSFAVELFIASDGVYVNEIAPRVHNTGHYTQDACAVSQFENHLRGCLGLPLGDTATAPFFAMRNILGPELTRDDVVPPTVREDSMLHWYKKMGVKPYRKLGHINVIAETKESLDERIRGMIEDEGRWVDSLGNG